MRERARERAKERAGERAREGERVRERASPDLPLQRRDDRRAGTARVKVALAAIAQLAQHTAEPVRRRCGGGAEAIGPGCCRGVQRVAAGCDCSQRFAAGSHLPSAALRKTSPTYLRTRSIPR